VQGVQRDPAELHRTFYATRFGRTLNALGYVRFRHWRIYGERGLARQRAAVWVYGETLLLEFSDEPLAQYSVTYESDRRQIRDVVARQLFETQHRSLQLPLWEMGDEEWLKVLRLPAPRLRHRPTQSIMQGPLW
jgi:hypothetical protein